MAKLTKKEIVKLESLYEPIDYYGKTWIVLTLCKEDLLEKEYLTKKEIDSISDENMSWFAEKFGDALMDCYWDVLSVMVEDRKEELLEK